MTRLREGYDKTFYEPTNARIVKVELGVHFRVVFETNDGESEVNLSTDHECVRIFCVLLQVDDAYKAKGKLIRVLYMPHDSLGVMPDSLKPPKGFVDIINNATMIFSDFERKAKPIVLESESWPPRAYTDWEIAYNVAYHDAVKADKDPVEAHKTACLAVREAGKKVPLEGEWPEEIFTAASIEPPPFLPWIVRQYSPIPGEPETSFELVGTTEAGEILLARPFHTKLADWLVDEAKLARRPHTK